MISVEKSDIRELNQKIPQLILDLNEVKNNQDYFNNEDVQLYLSLMFTSVLGIREFVKRKGTSR